MIDKQTTKLLKLSSKALVLETSLNFSNSLVIKSTSSYLKGTVDVGVNEIDNLIELLTEYKKEITNL